MLCTLIYRRRDFADFGRKNKNDNLNHTDDRINQCLILCSEMPNIDKFNRWCHFADSERRKEYD